MARRRHLIAYDISDPVRLRRVIKVMESFGDRLQYSVFLCDLTKAELLDWRNRILLVLDLTADSVVVIDLAAPGSTNIEMIGRHRNLPKTGATIV